ncbi:hypothetical protein ANCCEY_09773 [Ancylostoma ceylanicum]|uniref:Uncharacterized protein n=1 Tax=Ancylostoma ceylanicum TaxID=53326 RepID=A0A0D6LIW8_9BILA|nr:hypothetical protein ANCCEY_09773 [Ancylostoma ceylanicum]
MDRVRLDRTFSRLSATSVISLVSPAPEPPSNTSPPRRSVSDVVLARCRSVSLESVLLSLTEGVRWLRSLAPRIERSTLTLSRI